jgi:hypothetical protein
MSTTPNRPSQDPESAVYLSLEICRLFECSPNEIPQLIEARIIPAPLPSTGPRGKRRWLKSKVDRKLGISTELRVLRDIVRDEVRRALGAEGV